MTPPKPRRSTWFAIEGRWWWLLLAGIPIVGLPYLLEPLLQPLLGDFNARAALLTYGAVVLVAFCVSFIRSLFRG